MKVTGFSRCGTVFSRVAGGFRLCRNCLEMMGFSDCVRNPREAEKLQVPSTSATPDFLWSLVALMKCMRLSLRKGAHVDLSGAA
jgi:hypothetical protein